MRTRNSKRRRTSAVKYPGAIAGTLVLFLLIACSCLAPVVTAHNPIEMCPEESLRSPGTGHPFGTDQYGRDLLSRILHGGRTTLAIGAAAVMASGLFGMPVGLVAGYWGGMIDSIAMRFMDVMLAFPGILLALVILAFLGSNTVNLILALGVSGMPRFARLIRGCVLTLREQVFVQAAAASGATDLRVVLRHVFPNLVPTTIVFASLSIGGMILDAAALGFLGLGVQPPTAEWGLMLNEARDYLRAAPWVALAPGIAIFVSVLCFNLVGDGVRDLLDPRMR